MLETNHVRNPDISVHCEEDTGYEQQREARLAEADAIPAETAQLSLGRADAACLVMEFNTCVASIHGRVQAATKYVRPLALMETEQRCPPSLELSSDSYEKHNHRCAAQQQQCPPAVDLLSALLALASLLQAVLHRLLRVIQQRRPLPQLPLHCQRVALHALRHAHQLIRQHVLR